MRVYGTQCRATIPRKLHICKLDSQAVARIALDAFGEGLAKGLDEPFLFNQLRRLARSIFCVDRRIICRVARSRACLVLTGPRLSSCRGGSPPSHGPCKLAPPTIVCRVKPTPRTTTRTSIFHHRPAHVTLRSS